MRDLERWKDQVELSLDGRQIFFLFFGSAVAACVIFVAGVLVGKRIEQHAAPAPAAEDPLAALDQLGAGDEDDLSFHEALGRGEHHGGASAKKKGSDKHAPSSDGEPTVEAKRDLTVTPPAVFVPGPARKPDVAGAAPRPSVVGASEGATKPAAAHDGATKPATPTAPMKKGEGQKPSNGKADASTGVKAASVDGKPAVTAATGGALTKGDGARSSATGAPVAAKKSETAAGPVGTKPAAASPAALAKRPVDGKHADPAAAHKPDAAPKPVRKPDAPAQPAAPKRSEPDTQASARHPAASDGATGAKADAAHRYTVQLSAFQTRNEAEEFLHKVQVAGYRPFLVESQIPGKGTFWRVRVGDFATKKAAVDVKADVERKQHLVAIVTSL